jgi:AraC family transcriptional regulator
MNHLSNIPLVRATKGDVLPGNTFSSVVLSSAHTNWQNLVIEEHHFVNHELDGFMYIQHVVAVNLGPAIDCEFKKDGRFQHMSKARNTIYMCPSHRSFHVFRRPRIEENESADVLYLALDPVFLSQTAETLAVYPDRVELIEQQRSSDPALVHIALALRAGVQAWRASDRMYGEALSTALAVHLLREYGGIAAKLQHAHHGLSREKLMRAIEYIQDQLHTDLTVSAIARIVHMSPHHFALLFKQSTGQSPYRYVVEARAKKAKELLASGKFSISEIAYQVGFADQSHLTRHLKHLFGVTPKMLIERRYLSRDSSKEPAESSRALPV